MEKIYIVGAGGFAREVAWLIEDINKKTPKYEIIGFVEDNSKNIGKELNGYKILGDIDYLNSIEEKVNVVIAIGTGKVRKMIVERIKNKKYPILIHPNVRSSNFVNIGEGSIICSGNIITTNIEIGKHVILNLDCTVGHDAILKDYTTILPGVHISGNTEVGEGTMLGTGTVVIQGVKIGENSIVGAGSVVVKEIQDNCTAVGSPAKAIKFHS